MNVRTVVAIFLMLALAQSATAQGFAGMAESGEGFASPDPVTRFSFPEDHGAHPEFRIEWWYLTANLRDADGAEYGVQWTLFRNALAPGGDAQDQAWMGHAAIASPEGHYYAQRLSRGGVGTAGITTEPFEAFIDEWHMRGTDLGNIRLFAQGVDFSYDLSLVADGAFVVHGANGFSVKSEAGLASHYYSQPNYQVEGVLNLPDGPVDVTGQGWLDREWSSQPLTPTQIGWDWISLHLDSGDKLMGYRLRDTDASDYTIGTWISADGRVEPVPPGDLKLTPTATSDVASREIPTAWSVSLPQRSLDISVTALYPQSWMPTFVPYWEGPVRIEGSHTGRGFLEMTGYE